MDRLKFGTAGIRGIFGEGIRVADMAPLCYAVEKVVGQGVYGVGFDTRKGCQALAEAIEAGMSWLGCEVVDFGLTPTPVLAFNIKAKGLKAGFAVTASHNPPEYAGIKLLDQHGKEPPIDVERRIETEIETPSPAKPIEAFGTITTNRQGVNDYIESLIKALPPAKNIFTVLVDCANGTASTITPRLLRRLGHRVLSIHSHPSWRFQGRPPEPTAEALRQTCELVKCWGVDFGVAHDGDADRLVLINKDGRILPDYILSTMMLKIISEKRRGNVVISINTSNAVESLAKERGCRVMRTRLGKTAELLHQRGGIYATEPSKIVDPAWGYWEDGLYGAAAIIQHLSSEKIELSQFINDIPYYFNQQVNLLLKEANYTTLRERVLKRYREDQVKEVQEIDGVRIIFQDESWLLFRVSGTEPKIRIYVEAKEEKQGRRLMDEAVELVRSLN